MACLARADLIGWDPKVSQNWSSKMRSGIVHHKSDRKSCHTHSWPQQCICFPCIYGWAVLFIDHVDGSIMVLNASSCNMLVECNDMMMDGNSWIPLKCCLLVWQHCMVVSIYVEKNNIRWQHILGLTQEEHDKDCFNLKWATSIDDYR